MTIDARFVILWDFDFFEKRPKIYRPKTTHKYILLIKEPWY